MYDDTNEYNEDTVKAIDLLGSFSKLEYLGISASELIEEDSDSRVTVEEDSIEDELISNRSSIDRMASVVQKLPQSLQNLRIIGATERLKPGIMRLARVAADQFPKLKIDVSEVEG